MPLAHTLSEPRFKRILWITWAVSLLLSCLILLHSFAIVPLTWQKNSLSTPQPNTSYPGNNLYLADLKLNQKDSLISALEGFIPLGQTWCSNHVLPISPAKILEDGRELLAPNAQHAEIAEKGQGRYSIWDGSVYFSTSDNSDPRTNGRKYEIYWPTPPSPAFIAFTLALTLFSTIAVAPLLGKQLMVRWRDRNNPQLSSLQSAKLQQSVENADPALPEAQTSTKRSSLPVRLWNNKYAILALAHIIYIILFGVSRLWFFLDFPLPGIYIDSHLYYAIAKQMIDGNWPEFHVRPPVYPLLLWFIYRFSGKLMTLVLIQTLLTFASTALMIQAIWRLKWRLAPLAALAAAGWSTTGIVLEHDTSILSESVYSSLLVFSFAFLLLAISATSRSLLLALSSVSMGLAILTRPAALFMLVIWLFTVGYLFWRRFGLKEHLSFIIPMTALLLALCTYNKFRLGVFTLSTWGEANLIGATAHLWEQDPSYSAQANTIIGNIQAKKQSLLTAEEQQLLEHSWDTQKLYHIYAKLYNPLAYSGQFNSYLTERELIRKFALDGIKKHPDQYLKFVWTNLRVYFWTSTEIDLAYFISSHRATSFYIDKTYAPEKGSPSMTGLALDFANPPPLKTIALQSTPAGTKAVLYKTPLLSLYQALARLRALIFPNTVWSTLCLITLALSSLRLLLTRARHRGAFAAFIVTIAVLGASLVVCLVELSMLRYIYPMEWAYYISPFLLFLAFCREDSYNTIRKVETEKSAQEASDTVALAS